MFRCLFPAVRPVFLAAVLVVIAPLAVEAQTPAPAAFTDGQKVEVREGDSWSPAEIVRKEGRKYLIRYEGQEATEEWVTIDRLRALGQNNESTETPATTPTATDAEPAKKPAAKPKYPQWRVGQTVEVKWGSMWQTASVTNKRGEWYLVTYTSFGGQMEWVEPWRIRAEGSREDNLPHVQSNRRMFPRRSGNSRLQTPIDDPPTPKPGPAPKADSAFGEEPEENFTDDPAFKEADTSSVKRLPLIGAREWALAPDAAAESSAKPFTPVALGAAREFGDQLTALAVARAAPVAVVCYKNSMPPERIQVEKVNVVGGLSKILDLEGKMVPLDISPDGKRLAVRSDGFHWDTKNRVEIWSIDGEKPKRTLLFFPYKKRPQRERDVEQAIFLDADHLLTVGSSKDLTLWDLTTARAIYEAGGVQTMALSPGGKYLAAVTSEAIVFLDPLTGHGLGELPISDLGSWCQLAFSRSGKTLAAANNAEILAWDLTRGELIRRFTLPIAATQIAMTPHDNYALLDSKYLVDISRRIVLWEYSGGASKSVMTPAGLLVFVHEATEGRNRSAILCSVELPHNKPLQQAAQLNADDLLLLQPGAGVSLKLNIGAEDPLRQQIVEHMKKQLAERQLVVSDDAPISLVITDEPGKQVEREYVSWPWHYGKRGEKVTITQYTTRVAIEFDGKTAWQTRSMSGDPGMHIQLKEGQTVQDYVNANSKHQWGYLLALRLPWALAKPHEPMAYGSSTITIRGVQDGDQGMPRRK